MKKTLSFVLSLTMLISLIGTTPIFANTKIDAPIVALNGSSMAVSPSEKEYRICFTPEANGYYEFDFINTNPQVLIMASILDSADEVVMQNVNTDSIVKTAAYLEAGERYYFVIESDGTAYSTTVTITEHNHNYSVIQRYPAHTDLNDVVDCDDGGLYYMCESCSEYYATEVYYYAASVSLNKTSYVYDGKVKKPAVRVFDRFGNEIPNSNYTVAYKNNKKAGIATATVIFNGVYYSGSIQKTFNIKPKKVALKSVSANKPKEITVKWKKDTSSTGYQIRYSTSKKFAKAKTKTVNITKNKTVSKVIKKLAKNKKYYVQIRAYKTSNNKKIYSDWSTTKIIKTKK